MSNLQEQSTIMYESTFVCPFSTFWARLPGRVVAYLPYFPSYSLHCFVAALYFPFYSLSPLFSILLFTLLHRSPLFSILLFFSPIFHLTLCTDLSQSSISHFTLYLPYFPSYSLQCSIWGLYFPSYSHKLLSCFAVFLYITLRHIGMLYFSVLWMLI